MGVTFRFVSNNLKVMEFSFLVVLGLLCVKGTLSQLTPPKYEPGEVIKRTDYKSVDAALDEVLSAGNVLEGRRCALGVANLDLTHELSNPAWYVESGVIYSSAAYTIPPYQTGLNLFLKRQVYTFGTAGIMSYEIVGTDYKVVMLWRVPWNTLLYDIVFNVKIYPKTLATDKAMYNQMMKYAGSQKSFGWMEKTEYGIKTRSTISHNTNAKFYVSIDASEYDPEGSPELYGECSKNYLNPTWLGKYCWKECVPTGYCWVNQKCDSHADCTGPLPCYDKCIKV